MNLLGKWSIVHLKATALGYPTMLTFCIKCTITEWINETPLFFISIKFRDKISSSKLQNVWYGEKIRLIGYELEKSFIYISFFNLFSLANSIYIFQIMLLVFYRDIENSRLCQILYEMHEQINSLGMLFIFVLVILFKVPESYKEK